MSDTRCKAIMHGRECGKLCYRSMESAEHAMAHILLHGSAMQLPRRVYLCEEAFDQFGWERWHLTSKEPQGIMPGPMVLREADGR